MRIKQPRVAFTVAACVLLVVVVFFSYRAVKAAGSEAVPPTQGIDNDSCFGCHATPGMQIELPSGEPLYLTVDRIVFNTATHGRLGYACVQCHTNIRGYPHDPITAETHRDFTLQLYTSCAQCHQDKYDATLDSVHQKALAGGNEQAAVCTDCHGAHDIGPPDVPLSKIPKTCERCHSQIYDRYSQSVHGAALLGEGNPDVPTCTSCHGVHDVEGPSNSPFRLFSPQICAQCHADEELMQRYGISTAVFDSYISDFHGTTVVLFEDLAPDQETNKPVCIDCHGVHDMRRVDDPESSVIKENLLSTCQKCHPDASTNFPAAWLSHYIPSRENAPLVFFVNLFYKVFIPTVIGGMLVYVLSDASKRIRSRRKERSHG